MRILYDHKNVFTFIWTEIKLDVMYTRYKREEFTCKQITYLLIFVPTMDSGTLKTVFWDSKKEHLIFFGNKLLSNTWRVHFWLLYDLWNYAQQQTTCAKCTKTCLVLDKFRHLPNVSKYSSFFFANSNILQIILEIYEGPTFTPLKLFLTKFH